MAWNDYFTFNDKEFVNATRTAAYAAALGLHWVKGDGLKPNPDLPYMLGHEDYLTPAADDAPWFEPGVPDTADFAGAIPINVTGIEDSTRTAGLFDYTGNGGRSIGVKADAKEVVFSLALVGATDRAVELGFRWLKRVLQPHECVTKLGQPCVGADLVYASARPVSQQAREKQVLNLYGGSANTQFWQEQLVGGPSGPLYHAAGPLLPADPDWSVEWARYARELRGCTLTRGPVVTSRRTLGGDGCGGAIWTVSLTLRAEDPFEYGPSRAFLRDFGTASDPYATPVTGGDAGSMTFTRSGECPGSEPLPLFDPNCKPVLAPPGPPAVRRDCFDMSDGTWSRRYAKIPANLLREWDELRPVFRVKTDSSEVRMRRLRVVAAGAPPGGNCGFDGDVVLAYAPGNAEVLIDNARERTLARYSDEPRFRLASSLTAHHSGGPVEWYGISCAQDYYLVLDWFGTGGAGVSVDVDLVTRSA